MALIKYVFLFLEWGDIFDTGLQNIRCCLPGGVKASKKQRGINCEQCCLSEPAVTGNAPSLFLGLSLLQLQQELICVCSPPLLTLRKKNQNKTKTKPTHFWYKSWWSNQSVLEYILCQKNKWFESCIFERLNILISWLGPSLTAECLHAPSRKCGNFREQQRSGETFVRFSSSQKHCLGNEFRENWETRGPPFPPQILEGVLAPGCRISVVTLTLPIQFLR